MILLWVDTLHYCTMLLNKPIVGIVGNEMQGRLQIFRMQCPMASCQISVCHQTIEKQILIGCCDLTTLSYFLYKHITCLLCVYYYSSQTSFP